MKRRAERHFLDARGTEKARLSGVAPTRSANAVEPTQVSRVAWLTALLIACGTSNHADEPAIVGVFDVFEACAIRGSWAGGDTSRCTTCVAYATTPKCDCGSYDYAGKCDAAQRAVREEPSCVDVDACVVGCKSDCACVDRCYQGRACKVVAAARDGCVAQVCEAECR